ncbi:MAG: S8 family peptidase [bacterium]|nr:S8 family peptidase [bacterium]
MRLMSTPIALGLTLVSLVGCGLPATMNASVAPRSTGGQQFDPMQFRADGVSRTQVLVSFRKAMTRQDLERFEARTRLQVKRTLPALQAAVVTVGASPEETVARLRQDAAVARAEVDRAVLADEVVVNDPKRGDQYALDKVNANRAWDVTRGSEQVVIGIVDSGVDLAHPDLKAKLLPGYSSVEPGKLPKDDMGHGTHVAGIAAASTDNGEGVAGLASNCKILPVRVLGARAGSAATIAEGLIWAADHGADVVNMSLGFYDENETVAKAVQYALSKNVVLVATMGNNNLEKKRYPAAYPGVIAVGSSDRADNKSTFSNFGAWMSVSAPGTEILSTFPTYPVAIQGPAKYAVLSGTSMAAPLVAGLCGLVRSKNPGMAPAAVKQVLETTAVDLGESGADKNFGNGRIDAFAALSR